MGSFLCTCRPGFRLRADRVSCEGELLAPPLALGPAPGSRPRPQPCPSLPKRGRQGASSFRRNFFFSSSSLLFLPPTFYLLSSPLPILLLFSFHCFPSPTVFPQIIKGKKPTKKQSMTEKPLCRSPSNLGSAGHFGQCGVSSLPCFNSVPVNVCVISCQYPRCSF